MSSHFENLTFYLPDILSKKMLDVGSGRGSFLLEVKRRGGEVYGLEYNSDYVAESRSRALSESLDIDVRQGIAECLPFVDEEFAFVNICEVIEHVENPVKLLTEVWRVLKPGGQVYLSAPNRFGLRDQHFGLYFINWLPRAWANFVIGWFGRHKDYSGASGRQNLAEMHYYTFNKINILLKEIGFSVEDMRLKKIQKKFGRLSSLVRLPYYFLRTVFFDSFHLLITKPE